MTMRFDCRKRIRLTLFECFLNTSRRLCEDLFAITPRNLLSRSERPYDIDFADEKFSVVVPLRPMKGRDRFSNTIDNALAIVASNLMFRNTK